MNLSPDAPKTTRLHLTVSQEVALEVRIRAAMEGVEPGRILDTLIRSHFEKTGWLHKRITADQAVPEPPKVRHPIETAAGLWVPPDDPLDC